MDTIPATDNGKLDRQRLPAPDFSDRHGLEFVAPRSNLEEVLARIWAEVLGVGRVGIHDNFFELGGDSILSIQVVARAHEEGVHISPRVLFQHQTVAELAAAAERDEGAALPQGPVVGPVPLAPIQRWFFEHDFTDPHHWNQALLLRPKEPPDLEAVAGAPPVASTVTRCSSS